MVRRGLAEHSLALTDNDHVDIALGGRDLNVDGQLVLWLVVDGQRAPVNRDASPVASS